MTVLIASGAEAAATNSVHKPTAHHTTGLHRASTHHVATTHKKITRHAAAHTGTRKKTKTG